MTLNALREPGLPNLHEVKLFQGAREAPWITLLTIEMELQAAVQTIPAAHHKGETKFVRLGHSRWNCRQCARLLFCPRISEEWAAVVGVTIVTFMMIGVFAMSPLLLGRGSQEFLIGGSPFLVRYPHTMDAERNDYVWISRWVTVHHSSMFDSDLTVWQDKISADAICDREAAASIVCCVTSMGERVWGQTAEQSHSLS